MNQSAVVDQIKKIGEPIFLSLGLRCVEIIYSGPRQGGSLKVFLDKEGGITLEDCARVSRSLGTALDVADLIPYRYTLEVSSPGLDRERSGVDGCQP